MQHALAALQAQLLQQAGLHARRQHHLPALARQRLVIQQGQLGVGKGQVAVFGGGESLARHFGQQLAHALV